MDVRGICSTRVVALDRGSTLQEAAELMRERHVGALVITEGPGPGAKAIGMVTDRDLVVEVMARGVPPDELTIGDLVQAEIQTIPASADLSETVATMEKAGVRRLLVTTPEGEAVDIVSFDDVVHALARQMSGLANAMRVGMINEVTQRGTFKPDRRPVDPITIR